MSKGKLIPIEGRVAEDLSNNKYKVELDNGVVVNAYIGGKIRINNIRILVGDVVTVELSPYDITTGRIVYRKNGK